jgi:hypothetical protein
VGARWKTFIRQHGGQNAAAIVRRYHGVVIDPGGLTKTADAVLSVCRCDRAQARMAAPYGRYGTESQSEFYLGKN